MSGRAKNCKHFTSNNNKPWRDEWRVIYISWWHMLFLNLSSNTIILWLPRVALIRPKGKKGASVTSTPAFLNLINLTHLRTSGQEMTSCWSMKWAVVFINKITIDMSRFHIHPLWRRIFSHPKVFPPFLLFFCLNVPIQLVRYRQGTIFQPFFLSLQMLSGEINCSKSACEGSTENEVPRFPAWVWGTWAIFVPKDD